MKKAQTEIVGLILVVILIMIGIFLLVFFNQGDDSTIPIDKEQKYAHSFTATLPKINTWCGTYKEVMQQCQSGRHRQCADACVVLHNVTTQILNRTLNEERKIYDFSITVNAAYLNGTRYESETGCNTTAQRTTSLQPVPLSLGVRANIELQLCR